MKLEVSVLVLFKT